MNRWVIALLVGLVPALAAADAPHAVLCRDYQDGRIIEPTTRFAPDSPKVDLVVSIPATAQANTFTFVWIAEDVGTAAPKNTLIETKAVPTSGTDNDGAWWTASAYLTRPTNGWPVGKYRVDVTVDGTPLTSVGFEVAPSAETGSASAASNGPGNSAGEIAGAGPGGESVTAPYDDEEGSQPTTAEYIDPPVGAPEPVAVEYAPPPMRYEPPPPSPYEGAVWGGGYWAWSGGEWAWATGHWMRPPQPAYVWAPPYYENRGGVVVYVGSHWGPPGYVFHPPAADWHYTLSPARVGYHGYRVIGAPGVFIPPPPGSRPGVIVRAPIGTSPSVVVSAPPVVRAGMRIEAPVAGGTHCTVVAPAGVTRSGVAVHASVPAQAHLAAAMHPVVRVNAPPAATPGHRSVQPPTRTVRAPAAGSGAHGVQPGHGAPAHAAPHEPAHSTHAEPPAHGAHSESGHAHPPSAHAASEHSKKQPAAFGGGHSGSAQSKHAAPAARPSSGPKLAHGGKRR